MSIARSLRGVSTTCRKLQGVAQQIIYRLSRHTIMAQFLHGQFHHTECIVGTANHNHQDQLGTSSGVVLPPGAPEVSAGKIKRDAEDGLPRHVFSDLRVLPGTPNRGVRNEWKSGQRERNAPRPSRPQRSLLPCDVGARICHASYYSNWWDSSVCRCKQLAN